MPQNKKSFFERLAGNITTRDDDEEELEKITEDSKDKNAKKGIQEWIEDDGDGDGQLTVDMYQTPNEIIIKAMVAGVKPEDLDVSITQDMITVKGSRQKTREVSEEHYYYKELYWGSFSRSILLPQEVDSENIDAVIKNGVLTIRLPKIDKEKTQKIKIKSD
jgi:HSP20 family protein